MNVVLLPAAGSADPPQQDVIDAIERLLSEARSGKLRAIAWVGVYPDWNTDVDWTSGSFSPELMAGISDLAYRFARMRHEQVLEEASSKPSSPDDPAA